MQLAFFISTLGKKHYRRDGFRVIRLLIVTPGDAGVYLAFSLPPSGLAEVAISWEL